MPWFLTFFVQMRLEGRQSPRRHIQTRDSAEGEEYQIVQTDKTNILIRPVPRRLNTHNYTLFSLPHRQLFCHSSLSQSRLCSCIFNGAGVFSRTVVDLVAADVIQKQHRQRKMRCRHLRETKERRGVCICPVFAWSAQILLSK